MHGWHYKLLSQVQKYLMDIGFFNLLSNEIRTPLNHTWGWYPNPNGPYPSIAKTTNSIQLDFVWSKSAASSTSKYPSFLSDRASGSPFFSFFSFLSFFFLLSTRYNVWYVRKEQNSGTDRLNLSPKKILRYYSPFNDADTWFHQKLCLYKSFAACFLLPTFCCFWTCLGILFRLGFYPCKHWLWLRHYLACFKASPFRILLMK